MISPKSFLELMLDVGVNYFTGVPDSLLKSFCGCLSAELPEQSHVIAANEGNAVGLAMGYYLATGQLPLVYLQNSGLGNIVNPLMSLADADVYGTPMLLMIGWRGKPGVKDEPQHVKQGRVMLATLDAMEIKHFNISDNLASATEALSAAIAYAKENISPVALVVDKGAFDSYSYSPATSEAYEMCREDAIIKIVDILPNDAAVVSTTGMASRELFEFRSNKKQGHERDFLTVGGMGHASQIALGIAVQQKDRTIVCLDGDGAAIMHLGGMSLIGQIAPKNYCHILLNNSAHESVGGQPTAGMNMDFIKVAQAAGYAKFASVKTSEAMVDTIREHLTIEGPTFLEVKIKAGHRNDLGRPTKTPQENKLDFMTFLNSSHAQ